MKLPQLEAKINYIFKNPAFLKEACTHSSLANDKKMPSNERMEFYGDSILQFIVTGKLFEQKIKTEGELTKIRSQIVSEKNLAKAIDKLDIINFLKMGAVMHRSKISSAVKCDFFEALLAAIYLDGGIENATDFVIKHLDFDIKSSFDYKTALQEELQKGKKIKIEYKVAKILGEAHNPIFEIDLFINGRKVSSGSGKTKKQAEENSAKAYLEK